MPSHKLLLGKTITISFVGICIFSLLLGGWTPRRSVLEPRTQPAALVRPALVRTPSPIFREGKDLIQIKAIDGKAPTFLDDKAIVPPGRHSFQLRIELRHESASTKERTYITRADTSLQFEVEADRNYLIDARENGEGLWVWATDLSDGIVVAGKPPPAEPAP